MPKETAELLDREKSLEFYEERYDQGYMDEWPIEKKRIVMEVLQMLQLPAQGAVLDYGCGNGVFTEVIRQALPSWEVYGTDTSKNAIANAKSRFESCTFFNVDDSDHGLKEFDLVFTHHVLEHVYDLHEALLDMDEYLKPGSFMVHFLPCGNEGSFEHGVCLLKKDGIDPSLNNRFFYEDEGHVRRLTTDELRSLCHTRGFELRREFYLNQYFGAIDLITDSGLQHVLDFTESSQTVDRKAERRLKRLRLYLLFVTVIRHSPRLVPYLYRRENKRLKHYLELLMGLPLILLSKPVDLYFKRKAREEWDKRKFERSGSEMCLFFERRPAKRS